MRSREIDRNRKREREREGERVRERGGERERQGGSKVHKVRLQRHATSCTQRER